MHLALARPNPVAGQCKAIVPLPLSLTTCFVYWQAPKTAFSAVEQGVDMTWTPVNVFEKSIGATQDTYSPRFVAYLARFLVNYDRCVCVCQRPCECK